MSLPGFGCGGYCFFFPGTPFMITGLMIVPLFLRMLCHNYSLVQSEGILVRDLVEGYDRLLP